MADQASEIEQLILDEVLPGSGRESLAPDQSLIGTGILDSLALLRLVVLIEKQFGVTVQDGELIPDNFETIERINTFLKKKKESAR
jgi:acyl carrier protein